MRRSTLCNNFLKINKVNCCSIIKDDEEGSFNHNGCDCCNGLATTTYECNGYDPKHKKTVIIGDVCGECIDYFYNGQDSKVEA